MPLDPNQHHNCRQRMRPGASNPGPHRSPSLTTRDFTPFGYEAPHVVSQGSGFRGDPALQQRQRIDCRQDDRTEGVRHIRPCLNHAGQAAIGFWCPLWCPTRDFGWRNAVFRGFKSRWGRFFAACETRSTASRG